MSLINRIFVRIFHQGKRNEPDEMKYLIACLGNIGVEYEDTRHNIGFKIADRLAKDLEATFTTGRLAQVAEMRFKGKTLVVIKPTTYMNLSGKAVKYWLNEEKIPIENLLVVNDDIALPGDGGSGVPVEPERDGYEFVGWATTAPKETATDEQILAEAKALYEAEQQAQNSDSPSEPDTEQPEQDDKQA